LKLHQLIQILSYLTLINYDLPTNGSCSPNPSELNGLEKYAFKLQLFVT
jgi:hypothetical protein